MKKFYLRWAGVITRDVGSGSIEAENEAEARQKWAVEHPYRRIDAITGWIELATVKSEPGSKL